MEKKHFICTRKFINTKGIFTLIIASFLLFTSCGSDLSRKNAKRMLLDKDQAHWHTLTLKARCHHRFYAYQLADNTGFELFVPKLVENGYLSFNRQIFNITYYNLTNKIMPFFKEDKGLDKYFVLAELNDIEVSGITGSDSHKTVKYTVTYTANELGNLVLNSTQLTKNRTAYFRKYDDGWRLGS